MLAAVGISFLLGDRIEAAAIAGVLLINMLIGFTTELRSRRAMEALLQFDVPRASVFRGGHLRTVPASALVPGDVVELSASRHVPADARLAESADLRTIEAALTGESLPVSKEAVDVLPAETVLAERTNMVYKGTTIAAGTALAVVTATGAATEVGRIGTLVADVREERTPLERRLDALGRQLVWLALAVAALIAGLTGLQGAPLELVIKTGSSGRCGRPGGAAGGRDDCPCGRAPPNGEASCAGTAAARRGGARLRDERLHRRDPHADIWRHVDRPRLDGGARLRRH